MSEHNNAFLIDNNTIKNNEIIFNVCSPSENSDNSENSNNSNSVSNISNECNQQTKIDDKKYSKSINNTPSSVKETIIKFDISELEKEARNRSKEYNISPVIRKTPNSKTDLIIQKIYSNRKNVIKCIKNSIKTQSFQHSQPVSSFSQLNKTTPPSISYSNFTNLNNVNNCNSSYLYNSDIENSSLNIKQNDINNEQFENDIELEKEYTPESDKLERINNITSRNIDKDYKKNFSIESDSSSPSPDTEASEENPYSYPYKNIDKKKRKYYKNVKMKKNQIYNIQPLNIQELNSQKTTPNSTPRISEDLWNDSIENYYLEFQKICKDESNKYKYLSHRNELISNILKFILLISGCFTFTLSISIPNSLFMNATTTISSCLTAIITSMSGFFKFDKNSEIQYNIYKELDKLYNCISLELLKPTYMRSDPYEFILSLQNRRDELLKSLQKK